MQVLASPTQGWENMPRVSNEKKNVNRLAGEFLVASRLSQRGYMITLQWGSAIGYDILVFDKKGNVAYVEVKSTASYPYRWVLQKKYANPKDEAIPLRRRFVCCVDLTPRDSEPRVYVFPARVVAKGLHYYFGSRFPKASSYHLSLHFKPQGRKKEKDVKTVGEYIDAQRFLEAYHALEVEPVLR
jgi:hypothetical protein